MNEKKIILDACCGGRLFWFQKNEPHTIYIDKRIRQAGHDENRPNHKIIPDMLMDNKNMSFPNKSFKLVVYDPPHLIGKEDSCRMIKQYGNLDAETWQYDIKRGFEECWRVLDDYGVLIFKWNDASKKRKEVLKLIGREPLFGHPNGSKIPTHWFCFMKIPN